MGKMIIAVQQEDIEEHFVQIRKEYEPGYDLVVITKEPWWGEGAPF